ncbi:MAG: Calx-beta domain-containing protein, partial [Chloroflexota bacterium]
MEKIRPVHISLLSLLFVLLGAYSQPVSAQASPNLIITEIMHNPSSSEPDWEWIEVYNAGAGTVDLSGFVVDDENSIAHPGSNIASGSIPAGSAAILYNGDALAAADFEAAWGNVNLIAVSGWTSLRMGLNANTDSVGIWSDFASYAGDHQTQNNTIARLDYSNGFVSSWPTTNNSASFYLISLGADPTEGTNWRLSSEGGNTPINTGYQSAAAGGNSGNDVGSPGQPIPETEFSISDASVTEGDDGTTQLNFSLTRTDNVTADAVTVSTADQTATAGEDYTQISGQEISFAADGDLSQAVTVTVQGDTDFEADETLLLSLSNPVGGLIEDGEAVGTIENDDPEPVIVNAVLTLSDALSISEGDDGTTEFEFVVTLDSEVPDGFTLAYTVNDGTAEAGQDYTDNDGELTFEGTADETQSIIVGVSGDLDFEADETFVVNLGEITDTDYAADIDIPITSRIGTILNDDPEPIVVDAILSLSDALSINEGDNGTTEFEFIVTLDSEVPDGFTLAYTVDDGTAVAGQDYADNDGELTFEGTADETQSIIIGVSGDLDFEADETFVVNLGEITDTDYAADIDIPATSRTGTILNDDSEPIVVDAVLTLSDPVSIDEGDSGTTDFEFAVTLDSEVPDGFTLAFTVNDGTATAGEDYIDNDGALIFEGETNETQSIIVRVNGDIDFEPDETFTLTLGAITDTDYVADIDIPATSRTGTILNDDPEPIVVDAVLTLSDPVSINEGDDGTTDFEFAVTLDSEVPEGFTLAYT